MPQSRRRPATDGIASASRTTSLAIANAVETAIPWTAGTALGNGDAYWDSANPTRLVARRKGLYSMMANVPVNAAASATDTRLYIRFIGGGAIATSFFSLTASTTNGLLVSGFQKMSPGEYIETILFVTPATSLSGGFIINPYMTMVRLGDS